MKWLFVLLLLASCTRLDLSSHQTSETFDFEAFAGENYGECVAPVYCGDLAYIDCHVEVDGPSYYFYKNNGTVISSCGGSCWHPQTQEQIDACATLCPPPQWQC